jgi:hypothetical protein
VRAEATIICGRMTVIVNASLFAAACDAPASQMHRRPEEKVEHRVEG